MCCKVAGYRHCFLTVHARTDLPANVAGAQGLSAAGNRHKAGQAHHIDILYWPLHHVQNPVLLLQVWRYKLGSGAKEHDLVFHEEVRLCMP